MGTVVSGTLLQGSIRINDVLMLGPDALGNFQPIAVKSIHRKRMPVKEVRGGQTASFALKKVCLYYYILGILMWREMIKRYIFNLSSFNIIIVIDS